MMDPVEELRQIHIHHRPKARFQIPGRFSNRRVGPSVWPESVTAGVKGGFVDWLQNLEHGLLDHPGYHVRNAKSALATPGLGNPNPPDVARAKASRQQITAQIGQQTRSLRFGLLNRLAVNPWCPLVAYDIQQRPRKICFGRHFLQQPIGIGRPGGRTCRGFALRCVQQPRAMLRSVRASPVAAPLRAVGEHEAQLTVSRPSQPISPFAQPAFTGVIAVGSEEARSIALALASVRRSNWTCGFPASSFHEDVFL
jgi:hypothetical protein